MWTEKDGAVGVHLKNYLPEEEGVWEASGYKRGFGSYTPATLHFPNGAGPSLQVPGSSSLEAGKGVELKVGVQVW